MNFKASTKFIKSKIKELEIPYFNIVVCKDGEKVFNYRESKYKDDNDLLTMYSMTKVITSVAFMQLVEKKMVKITDPVSKYLSGYKNLKLLNGNKVKKEMTIKHLLTMTAGLDYDHNRPALVSLLKKTKNPNTIDVCETFAKDGLVSEPGEKFNYSLCADVVGAIIEKVSKQTFSSYIEEHIFKPCGMKNSTVETNLKLLNKTVPDVYFKNGKATNIEKISRLVKLSKNFSSGGASLISTPEDFSKFLNALLEGKLISKKSLDLIDFSHIKETPFCLDVQKYSIASFDYGYGFLVRVRQVESPHGMPVGEFGWDGAAGSYCLCDRKNNISIVMGMNIQDWPNYIKDLHVKIVEQIYDELRSNELI